MLADLRELYDSDPRPTFIVDCEAESTTIYHVNAALRAIPHIALSLHSHDAFSDWWRVATRDQQEFRHRRYRWMKFSACKKLFVTIVEQPSSTEEEQSHFQMPIRVASLLIEKQSPTIFTVRIQSPEVREHVERIRRVNWSKTALGPISGWSRDLNVLVTTLISDTRPTALFLGPDRTILYNLAYGAISGSRHPEILGKSIIDAWCVSTHA
jgi:hypothetical protein